MRSVECGVGSEEGTYAGVAWNRSSPIFSHSILIGLGQIHHNDLCGLRFGVYFYSISTSPHPPFALAGDQWYLPISNSPLYWRGQRFRRGYASMPDQSQNGPSNGVWFPNLWVKPMQISWPSPFAEKTGRALITNWANNRWVEARFGH